MKRTLASGFWLLTSSSALLLFGSFALGSQPGGYVGARVCAECHARRVAEQGTSNHANTWAPPSSLGERRLPGEVRENAITYLLNLIQGRWHFQVQLPDRPAQAIPVHSVVGGKRFGTSFILQAETIESRSLPRATLIEARYMLEAGTNQLKLSPGFPTDVPHSYETALGRVMSPQFAQKCMHCHGGIVEFEEEREKPIQHPVFVDTGVRCERCHGPGAEHVAATRAGQKEMRILHPGRLSNPELMELCGRCHSGFFSVPQPRPQDLLISNQVTALSHSECYIQSKAGFSCLTCHDPHIDARHDDPAYQAACLSCHSSRRSQAVICPVNAASGCIDCHMPMVVKPGNFKLTDHWIRVID